MYVATIIFFQNIEMNLPCWLQALPNSSISITVLTWACLKWA